MSVKQEAKLTRVRLAVFTASLTLLACNDHGGQSDRGEDSPLDAGTLNFDVDTGGAKDPRPDIVLVVADDMRWDLMSGENHPFVDTPNLGALAADAAKMNNAFVPVQSRCAHSLVQRS